jgi:hypothetical protein
MLQGGPSGWMPPLPHGKSVHFTEKELSTSAPIINVKLKEIMSVLIYILIEMLL